MLIGISGHFKSGKDEVAKHLMSLGYARIAFADILRTEVSSRLKRTLTTYAKLVYGKDEPEFTEKLLIEKDPFTRALLQEYGTDVRRADDPDYWVKRWTRCVGVPCFDGTVRIINVVAPDVRFPNEARCIKDLGGYLWLVKRPGYNGDSHESETFADEYQGWDAVLINDGAILDLHQRVEAALASLAR